MNQLYNNNNNSFPSPFKSPSRGPTPINPALLHTPGPLPYVVHPSAAQSVPPRPSVFQSFSPRPSVVPSVFQSFSPRPFVIPSVVHPSVEQSVPPTRQRRAQGARLTEEQDTALLQICPQMKSAYVVQKKRTEFWGEVEKKFRRETGRNCSLPRRRVDMLVKKRKDYLDGLVTGSEDQENNYTIAIDAWIRVVDSHKAAEDVKKLTVEQKVAQGRWEERVKNNLMHRISRKRTLDSPSKTSNTDNNHDSNLPRVPRATSFLQDSLHSPGTPAASTTSDSHQQRGAASGKKARTNEESPSIVALTNAVELFVWSQCERGTTGTEARAVEARATESIRLAEEARAAEAIWLAKEVRTVRQDMTMWMERLERMLSVLVNQVKGDTPR